MFSKKREINIMNGYEQSTVAATVYNNDYFITQHNSRAFIFITSEYYSRFDF